MMKAKEYFEKYEESLMAEYESLDCKMVGAACDMYVEFVVEMKEMIASRNVKTDRGAISVIREQNDKWNAVVNLFMKAYGKSPIARDGFKTALNKQLEEEK